MSEQPLILVIEDAPSILEIMIHALQGAGFRTKRAITALEGVRMARQEIPDLILADVCLPGQDGATAMSCLKDNPDFTDIPLILVSALPHDQLALKMSECGAVDIIEKPFEAAHLVSSVKHWLAVSGAAAVSARPSVAAAPKPFEILTREVAPGTGELRIVGAIGISSQLALEAGFQDLFGRNLNRILVNLKETRSILSSGIGTFLSARETAIEKGGDLVFVAIPPEVQRIFAMLGILRLLRSAETEELALAQLGPAAPRVTSS